MFLLFIVAFTKEFKFMDKIEIETKKNLKTPF